MLRRGLEAPQRCGRPAEQQLGRAPCPGRDLDARGAPCGPAAPPGAGGLARRPAGRRPGGFHEVL